MLIADTSNNKSKKLGFRNKKTSKVKKNAMA